MVELAIQDNRRFQLSRIELDRPAPSYTIDTIRRLQSMPEYRSTQWFFLLGSDAAQGLATWREWETLQALVEFLVVPRPGHSVEPLPAGATELPVKTLDVSASDIRRRVKEGRSIRYLVPEPVRLTIEERQLYR